MSRGALLTGTVGGVVGSITSFIGIIWSIISVIYFSEYVNYYVNVVTLGFLIGPYAAFIGYPTTGSLFSFGSVILAILILVTGILIGIGFYGTYKIGGGAMGVVGLIFGLVGGIACSLLNLLGNLMPTTEYLPSINYIFPISVIIVPLTHPTFSIIFIGFMILGVAFILLGSASITVREMTAHPAASSAAGILSIIGGAFLIAGALISGFLMLIGFVLLFASFIIWAVVFYSSRNM